MAVFNKEKAGWRPQIGELIIGLAGKREVLGRVLESTKKPGKPAIFSRGSGFTAVYVINVDTGKQQALVDIRPAD